MRAGNLDRIITIERETTGLDLYGTPIRVWVPLATMRAQKLESVISDRESARGSTTDNTITFRTRWLDRVTLESRIIYEGYQYSIRQIKEIGRRVGLDIACERIGP
jgi:SPP1 family predicted phage head-tail adaptor